MPEPKTPTAVLEWSDYGIMVLYLLFVLFLGVLFSRKEKNTEEYLLGGRRMPWFVIGISYMVSLMSTISLVSVPGEAYAHGLTKSLHTFMAPFAAVLSFFLFVRFYFRVNTFTPFAYLERRFDRRVRLLGTLVFWWTRLVYLAIVLYSSSKVFQGAAGWSIWQTVLLVGIVGIVYTTMGGMKAVVWTDFSQFIILVGGVALTCWYCGRAVEGGLTGIVEYAFSHNRGFDAVAEPGFFSLDPHVRLTFWLLVVFILQEHLFYNSSDQISIQRLLSTSSYTKAKKSLYTFVVIGLPFGLMLWFLGLAVFTYYGQHPHEAGGITGDTALFRYVATHLPSPLPGLIISAMLAAVMSTLDSGMNSLSAVATKDIYTQYFRREATEQQQVRFSRAMTVVVGILAVTMALVIASVSEGIEESIMEANTIWGAFVCVLPPIFLLGVTTRRARANHVLWGCLVSWSVTVTLVTWYVMSKRAGNPISFMFVSTPGMLVMLVWGYVAALLSPEQDPAKVDGLTLWTLNSRPKEVAE